MSLLTVTIDFDQLLIGDFIRVQHNINKLSSFYNVIYYGFAELNPDVIKTSLVTIIGIENIPISDYVRIFTIEYGILFLYRSFNINKFELISRL
jgi:hypothetical protein